VREKRRPAVGDHEPELKDEIKQQPSSNESPKLNQGGDRCVATDQLKFHPLADLLPLMEGEEFDALVADIKASGLRERIMLYEGKILDGRNRYRACLKAGFEPVTIQLPPICDPVAYVISANIRRRHLTADQKRDLIAKLIKATPEKSDRQIAETAKASPTTVGTVRAKMEAKGDVSNLDTRTDTKGRKQPAKKKKAKISKIMVTEANGKTRPATEAEVSALNDAVKRVGEFGIPTQCNVEAALANPIIKAWRVADDFNRANFVRLYRKDIEHTIATLDDDVDPEDDGLDISACPGRAARDDAL
jgi:ParB-like chromosome segregation protein Spo0J